MAYLRDYKKSSMIKDQEFADLFDKMLNIDLGGELQVTFQNEKELKATRYNLYSLLNSLGRKEDFVISKVGKALIIKPRVPTTIEVVEINKKEDVRKWLKH